MAIILKGSKYYLTIDIDIFKKTKKQNLKLISDKTLCKIENHGFFFKLINYIYLNPEVNILLTGKHQKHFHWEPK